MHNLLFGFYSMLKRELAINMARQSEWLAVLLFYIMVIILFPIALGNIPNTLVTFSPAIIWVAVLLTTYITQESILRTDYQMGIFDQMLLSKYPFSLLMLAKILGHWLIFAVPMILLTPILALSLSLSTLSIAMMTLSLILGTLILFLVGAIGSALTVSLARGGVLLAILILPLYVPVLVLGSSVGILSTEGILANGQIALLAALAIVSLLCAPLVVAAAIRVSLS